MREINALPEDVLHLMGGSSVQSLQFGDLVLLDLQAAPARYVLEAN